MYEAPAPSASQQAAGGQFKPSTQSKKTIRETAFISENVLVGTLISQDATGCSSGGKLEKEFQLLTCFKYLVKSGEDIICIILGNLVGILFKVVLWTFTP